MLWMLLIALPILQVGLKYLFAIEVFWYFEYSRLFCLGLFCLALLFSYFAPIIWIRRTHQYWVSHISKANFFVLMAIGIVYIAGVGLPRTIGPYHLATTRANGHVYYLGYVEVKEDSYTYLMSLYRCDRFGFFCTAVCEYPITGMARRKQFDLLTDDQAHTVALTLNDEPVCISSFH